MGNMLQAAVTITGTRPLLWHHFGPEALSGVKRERAGTAGNDPTEWKRTVLVAEDRRLYLENTQVFGALRDGARHTKRGRGSVQPLLVATLQVLDDRALTDRYLLEGEPPTDSSAPVYLDIRGVVNPTTKARNVRYRIAAAPGWGLTFRITWDKTIISRAEMEAICGDTGRLVGIGNGRAVGFGRFAVCAFLVDES